VNAALRGNALQINTYRRKVAAKATDNDPLTSACTRAMSTEPWWALDLLEPIDVATVTVVNDNHRRLG